MPAHGSRSRGRQLGPRRGLGGVPGGVVRPAGRRGDPWNRRRGRGGARPAPALSALYIRGDIVALHNGRPLAHVAHQIAERARTVVILTDWDTKGGQLARRFRVFLEAMPLTLDLDSRRASPRRSGGRWPTSRASPGGPAVRPIGSAPRWRPPSMRRSSATSGAGGLRDDLGLRAPGVPTVAGARRTHPLGSLALPPESTTFLAGLREAPVDTTLVDGRDDPLDLRVGDDDPGAAGSIRTTS